MQEIKHNSMGPSAYSRQKRLIEIGVISLGFVLLPVLQGLILSFTQSDWATRQVSSPVSTLAFAWQFILLIYLLNSSMPRLFRTPVYWKFDSNILLRGFCLAMTLLAVAFCIGLILPHTGTSTMPFKRPAALLGYMPVVFTLIVAVLLEELLFRVYYLERLITLGATPIIAVVIAVPLFAIGHQYQGFIGVAMAGILGTILSFSWLRWRNFWINCIGHLLYNGIILFFSFAYS